MKDNSKIELIKINYTKDTISYNVDKSIIDNFTKEKSTDTFQILAITLPILASILIVFITRYFDNISEDRRHKRELASESRKQRQSFLKFINKLITNLEKTNDPDAMEDYFYEWTANKMIGEVNPFENLKINANLYFKDILIVELIDKLYTNAETINRQFDWAKNEHGSESIALGESILKDIRILRDKIAENLKTE